jgi:hypothetical protein
MLEGKMSEEIWQDIAGRWENKCSKLYQELKNIASAKRDKFENAEEFRQWAQSRARHAMFKNDGG